MRKFNIKIHRLYKNSEPWSFRADITEGTVDDVYRTLLGYNEDQESEYQEAKKKLMPLITSDGIRAGGKFWIKPAKTVKHSGSPEGYIEYATPAMVAEEREYYNKTKAAQTEEVVSGKEWE